MEVLDVLTTIGGLMMGIISYFLKMTMNDLKEVKQVAYETSTKLKVIQNDYINKIDRLNEKFDLLNDSIRDLTAEIKVMNKRD